MIDCMIFSRDRPMQLDACLRSLEQNAPGVATPRVLWTATNEIAEEGYRHLIEEWGVHLVEEGPSFAATARLMVEEADELLLLLCDDAITYRPAPVPSFLPKEWIAFSMRLGRNTTYCHPRDLQHDLPPFESEQPYLTWDWHSDPPEGDLFEWHGREGDFGYPYSIDGVIHRRDSILEWIEGHDFKNPNQMEGCIVASIGQRRDLPPLLASFPESVQVGLPINVVNQTHNNRVGLQFPQSTDELNRRFLHGERIDFDAMDFSGIIGAHQELPLVIR